MQGEGLACGGVEGGEEGAGGMGAAVGEEVEEKIWGAGLGCGTARGAGSADDSNSGDEGLPLGARGVVEHVGGGGADE